MTFQYCKQCLNPSTRPSLHFSDDGVCSACTNYTERKSVDWEKRKVEFLKVIEQYRNKNSENYDCIIGVSGGKDSTYQVVTAKKFGLRPLAVTAVNCALSDIGRRNLNNLNKIGVDKIEFSTSKPVRAAMNRHALRTIGDISWPEHASITAAPLRLSVQMGIPLQIWGENGANEYGGKVAAEASNVRTTDWMHSQLNGLSPHDFIGVDGITKGDLLPFTLPSPEELRQSGTTGIFLGYYLPWDGLKNAVFSQGYGLEVFPHSVEGSMVNYENLDNYHTGIHDYFMYLKFGFGRTTTLASMYIRRGRLSREEGAALAARHDGRFPSSYLGKPLHEILSDIDMEMEEFVSICDTFTNKDIFETNSQGKLVKRKDGSPQLKQTI